ncbi:MAG: O-antigen ligase family protein [Clostridiales bacterium]|jgi:O-antigen ligase|nr:O-antigen ligase family protein [Clostridiales bacterium]
MTGSVFLRFLTGLYSTLISFYEYSRAAKITAALAGFAAHSVIVRAWRSIFCVDSGRSYAGGSRVFSLLYGLPKRLGRLTALCPPLFESSGFLTALNASFIGRFENLFLLFLSVTFLVPGQYWRNQVTVLGAGLLAVYFAALIAAGKRRACPGTNGSLLREIPPALVVFAALSALSLAVSHDLGDSLRIGSFLFSGIAVCVLIQFSITSRAMLDRFVAVIFAVMFLTAVYGFWQFASGIEVRLEFVDLATNAGMPGRVFSTMENPNNYAEFLTLFLPVCLAFVLNRRSDLARLVTSGMFLVCAAVLLLTYSRSSYVVAVFAFALFILLRNKRLIPFALVLAMLCLPFIPSSIANRFMSITSGDSSSTYRFIIWRAVQRMLAENFVWLSGVGMGPEAFGKVYRAYAVIEAMTAMHSHNLFLQVWVETGLFGLASFIALLASTWKRNVAAALNTADLAMKNYFVAFAASIAGIALFGMVEYVWFYPRIMLAFWVMMGLAMAAARLSKKPEPADGARLVESGYLPNTNNLPNRGDRQ